MKLIRSSKGKISTILILIGALLIGYSFYNKLSLKLYQNRMLEEYKESYNDSNIKDIDAEETPTIEVDEKSLKEDKKEVEAEKAYSLREEINELKMIIEIPKIGVNASVVNGTTPAHLRKGPGLYEISAIPSETAVNVVIAGHRTTYGAWFRRVDELKKDDDIIINFENKNYNYKVEKVFIIEKNDWSVTKKTDYSALTLTSCYPLHSSKQRIVVRARLDSIKEEK